MDAGDTMIWEKGMPGGEWVFQKCVSDGATGKAKSRISLRRNKGDIGTPAADTQSTPPGHLER